MKQNSDKEMPQINARIRILVNELTNGKVSDFVRMAKIKNHQNLNRIFNIDRRTGRYPEPSAEILTCIKIYLPEVNFDWVVAGKGSVYKDGRQTNIVRDNRGIVGIQGNMNTVTNYVDESNVSKAMSYIHDDLVQVPFVSRLATAGFIESNCDKNSISDTVPVFGITHEELKRNGYIAFEVMGDSMEPTLNDKARILAKFVDPNNWEYADNGVFIVCYRDLLVAKRIKTNTLMLTDTLKLISDNQKGGETVVRKSDIRGIWKVIRIIDQIVL